MDECKPLVRGHGAGAGGAGGARRGGGGGGVGARGGPHVGRTQVVNKCQTLFFYISDSGDVLAKEPNWRLSSEPGKPR